MTMRALFAAVAILALAVDRPAPLHAQTVADALDQPGLTFTGSGDAAWFGQTASTWDGTDALQSGAIGDGQSTAVQVEATYLNDGRVRFWWGVSSETDADAAVFSIDGVEAARISGEVPWEEALFTVGPGTHVFRWEYRKDGDGAAGLDCAWIDVLTVIDLSAIVPAWSVSLNGPSGGGDGAADVAAGPDGHLYVAGTMDVAGAKSWLGKFSPDGSRVWSKYFPGRAEGVAVAPDGSVYVTGSAAGRMYLWKFAPTGCYWWRKSFPGNGMAVAVSASGRAVYAAGSASGDVVVRKLTPAGGLVWTRTFNGSARRGDEGRAVVVDPAGNLYVAGSVRSRGQGRNIWLRKYAPGGRALWTREVSREGAGDDWASGLALDVQGNVYVAGAVTFEGRPTFWAGAYSPLGDRLWGGDLIFPQYREVRAGGLTVGADGTVNVIGTGVADSGARQPFLVRLKATDGAVVDEYDLAPQSPGLGGSGEAVIGFGDGNVFVGSVRYPDAEGGNDILVVRYR